MYTYEIFNVLLNTDAYSFEFISSPRSSLSILIESSAIPGISRESLSPLPAENLRYKNSLLKSELSRMNPVIAMRTRMGIRTARYNPFLAAVSAPMS